MLTLIDNLAVVQIIQFLVLVFFLFLGFVIVAARLKLPKTKCEPLIDLIMVLVLLIYGTVLKIYFST